MRFRLIATGIFAIAALTTGAEAGCVKKAGSGWGMTKGMAQFQSFEIIEQVTGNWPIRKDKISKPVYNCKQGSVGWTCKATATVCKS